MSITRGEMEKGSAYPIGTYELEIKEAKHVEGVGKTSGKPWEKVSLLTEIVTPEELSGRKFFADFFYDNRLVKLLQIGLEISDKDFDALFDGQGQSASLNRERLFEALQGSFFKCRIGINDAGYNQVAEILKNENTKSTPI